MMKLAKVCLLAAALVVPSLTANAHPLWILPSHFTVSKQEGDWIAFDVTASHTTFAVDKPAGALEAYVLTPSGKKERPDAVLKGKRRSVFDFFFVEQGTHKVIQQPKPFYMTTYKSGKRDAERRARINKAEIAQLPEKARDISTIKISKIAETYITVMAPTKVTAPNKGFAMQPITHPADIVEQSPVTFQFLYDGKPQAGVEATVTQDGTLYRESQQEIKLTSDSEGKVTFTPNEAGRYLLATFHTVELENNALADKEGTMYRLSFEAQLD
ncbi:DUF4198 domain-containing protein [Vibrio methylphosphonaticus]|uniref:DUF4198 domain-containing protein n=1 Tax=Vibrio methylphosphonaticus TaxID=2946866 RepID=UPI00202A31C5|nr:DUF4198 domain-containing protein [Vibrio methylphosphonaticus]MCL9776254.1 DUF4198 domain-containing protein [Vibrio methylphosphonaticus]